MEPPAAPLDRPGQTAQQESDTLRRALRSSEEARREQATELDRIRGQLQDLQCRLEGAQEAAARQRNAPAVTGTYEREYRTARTQIEQLKARLDELETTNRHLNETIGERNLHIQQLNGELAHLRRMRAP